MAVDTTQPPVLETIPGPPPVPTETFKCPSCEHEAACPGPPATSIIACSNCGQRVAYGAAIPRCAVSVHPEDARYMLFSFEHTVPGKEAKFSLAVDALYAREFALAILRKRTA